MSHSNKSLLDVLLYKLDATPGLLASETKLSGHLTDKDFDNVARSMAPTLLRKHFDTTIPIIRSQSILQFLNKKIRLSKIDHPDAEKIKTIISNNYSAKDTTTCSKLFDKHMRKERVKIVKIWLQLLHGRPRHIFIDSMSFLRWDFPIHQSLIQSGGDEAKNCVLGMIG